MFTTTIEEIELLDDNAKVEIDSYFFYEFVKSFEESHTRIVANLIDSKGDSIEAVIWKDAMDRHQMYDLEGMFVARIKGKKASYRGKSQVTINEITPVSPDLAEYNELLCAFTQYKQQLTDEEKNALADKLMAVIGTVQNKYYHKLLEDLFSPAMVKTFKEWTAAWERHHAFPGGLLLHTVGVAEKCAALADVQKTAVSMVLSKRDTDNRLPNRIMDRDLLVTAALLHDIAKVKEYSGFPAKRRLYIGRMLFHAYMGAEMVAMKINEYRNADLTDADYEYSDFPEVLETQLKHCILSHHGRPEYGAAVLPMLLEAKILHMMDDADAQEQYYWERVVSQPQYDASREASTIRGYYDEFTREYAYPTMHIQAYQPQQYFFNIDEPQYPDQYRGTVGDF